MNSHQGNGCLNTNKMKPIQATETWCCSQIILSFNYVMKAFTLQADISWALTLWVQTDLTSAPITWSYCSLCDVMSVTSLWGVWVESSLASVRWYLWTFSSTWLLKILPQCFSQTEAQIPSTVGRVQSYRQELLWSSLFWYKNEICVSSCVCPCVLVPQTFGQHSVSMHISVCTVQGTSCSLQHYKPKC